MISKEEFLENNSGAWGLEESMEQLLGYAETELPHRFVLSSYIKNNFPDHLINRLAYAVYTFSKCPYYYRQDFRVYWCGGDPSDLSDY